jgi:hypothetical protein
MLPRDPLERVCGVTADNIIAMGERIQKVFEHMPVLGDQASHFRRQAVGAEISFGKPFAEPCAGCVVGHHKRVEVEGPAPISMESLRG